MKRQLIINADDLGYTQGVNLGICQCFMERSLRSATLMASGQAFEQAVAFCKANPALGVGVHLALTEMAPLAPEVEIQGLLNSQGLLPSTPGSLFASLKRGKIQQAALFKELDLQVAKIVDAGLKPTHLDSHKHIHAIPEVLEAVIRVARRHAIRWIRNPFETSTGMELLPLVTKGEKILFCKQHVKAKAFSIYRQHFLRRIAQVGMHTPHHFFGVSLTGIWNEAAMIQLLEHLPSGISEWMFHPAICDEELRRQRTRLLEQRENERKLLISPHWKDLIHKHEIIVTHYGEQRE